MIRKYLVFAFLFVYLFSACEQEEVLNSTSDLVAISTYIQSHDLNTRANIGYDGTGTFAENDRMTLQVTTSAHTNEASYDLTLRNQVWTPSLSWENLGNTASFSAFYPCINETNGPEFTHEVFTNQNSGDNFEKSDLLFASKVTAQKGEAVKLTFNHLMSCLSVQLKGDAFSAEELAQAVVIVKGFNKIQIKKEGQLGELHDFNSHAHKENNASEITLKHQEGSTFQAILCPQNISQLDWGSDWLKIRIKGKEYQLRAPEKLNDGTRFDHFEPGKNTTFVISLNESDAAFTNQTRWVYGIKDMPDVNGWKYHDAILKFKGLPWNSHYGWYDCNKVSTTLPGDMNLCWAATSSNMIHWWLDNNQRYLDKMNYTGPRAYNNHLESEVFQAFKDNFIDEGYFPNKGLNWFFQGGPVDASQLKNINSGGYFKQVFSKSLVEKVFIPNYKSLNNTLKKAFDKKQAIGLTILMEGFGSAHALTIWGAEFDDRGNVRSIYYVENNDRSAAEQAETDKQTSAGMLVAKVGERNGQAVMENSQHELSIPITELTLLNLGEDQWEKYFQNH